MTCKLEWVYLKQVPAKALPLILFMNIKVQDTDWLYLTEGSCFCADEQPFPASLDASKDRQSAARNDL